MSQTIAEVQFDSFILRGLEARLALSSLTALYNEMMGKGDMITELMSISNSQIDNQQMQLFRKIGKTQKGKVFIGKLIRVYSGMSQEEISNKQEEVGEMLEELIKDSEEINIIADAEKIVRLEKQFLEYAFKALKKTQQDLDTFMDNMRTGDIQVLMKAINEEKENRMDFSMFADNEEDNTTDFTSTPSIENKSTIQELNIQTSPSQ